jgi:hypothetical protein
VISMNMYDAPQRAARASIRIQARRVIAQASVAGRGPKLQ